MKPKIKITFALSCILLTPLSVFSQGTFIYDQQSALEAEKQEGGAGILSSQPIQSFTPSLSSVGFVRLYLYDAAPGGNGVGGTVYVNVRSGLATGTILGSTEPVSMPDGYAGFTNFFFSSAVSVIPGTSYFLEPVLLSGDPWGVNKGLYNYSSGTAFFQGAPDPFGSDLWFREGVIPEPSSVLLLSVGLSLILFRRKTNSK